ncbi:phage tail protein [Nostoc sp. LPT]|uniref:phage tail protein n=1 Tax=Nostoc sp. LPT TaxID=2815387 RepID=UPI001D2D6661|nr:phage tail protein [Nostoc sp. LPT]MBN4003337.1 phage tail protein [Nostoc sp. LPT]
MAKGEVLACSKFYVEIDGLSDLIVKKVSGISIELQTAGDQNPFGVTKGGKSAIQATVTGVSNGTVTVEYVSTVQDDRLIKWYTDSHSQPTTGGGTTNKGVLKTASIILYNQGGEEAARWNLTGVMPKTYKSSQLEAGTTELATETVELAFHSIRRIK